MNLYSYEKHSSNCASVGEFREAFLLDLSDTKIPDVNNDIHRTHSVIYKFKFCL